jgi:(p)ppGpp synthase/HD superfamily hydrolase
MIYTPLTKKALRLCFDAHREQVDKTGLPYVFHPFHLAEQMKDEYTTVCALLHDVVEDTDYTLEDLRDMGFPHEVVDALALLTHDPAVPYMDYVKVIATNPIARKVKMADLRHNSDLSRMDEVDEWAAARTEKYKKALRYLRRHNPERNPT